MIGKGNHAIAKPTIAGIMSQTSTHGATIPRIYGTPKSSPLVTWMGNITKHSSSKKGSKKGGVPNYRCNLTMLIGHNPILGVGSIDSSNTGLGLIDHAVTGSGPTFTINDPDFVQLVAVTVTQSYSVTFNDYGGGGPFTLSGSYQIPLWNTAVNGPDPINASGYKFAPYTYYNAPGSPVVSQLHAPGGSYTFYYEATASSGYAAHTLPLAKILNSYFESSLGDGPEYAPLPSQQIIYPWFAGAGSTNFDLGAGALPQMRIEVYGPYGLYHDSVVDGYGHVHGQADADFADMVEDIFKMGQTQGALLGTGTGTPTALSPIQPGVSCWDYPGTVQKKFWAQNVQGNFTGSIQYDLPVTVGNILVVAVAQTSAVNPIGVSDSLGNTWTPVLSTTSAGFFYSKATNGGIGNVVTITNAVSSADVQIFEIAGCDTVDSAVASNAFTQSFPTGTVTSTTNPGQPAYILSWVFPDTSATVGSGVAANWKSLVAATAQGGNFFGVGTTNSYSEYRVVRSPGTYTFTGDAQTVTWKVVMLALKNSVALPVPMPLGDILDQPSLDLCRKQCRAAGLWGSLTMNSQKKASEWLADLYLCMNSAFVWSGFTGKSIPYSEVSNAGNGAIYTAPTASGPIASLTPSDMIGTETESVVSVERKAVVDRPNLLRIQHPNRPDTYNPVVVSQPEIGSLSLFGLRYATPKELPMIQRVAVSRMVLGIMVRRQSYIVNTYKFKLQAKWKLLEPMDLVTITDPLLGINQLPVRIISVEEDKDYNLNVQAEDFIYGVHAPNPVPVTENVPNSLPTSTIPLPVNAPIFLEPPGILTGVTPDQLWILVSDSDPNYGGCEVYMSVDGGASYSLFSVINGNATTGLTTNLWPQALDPDTTNNLSVDLTESRGALAQYSVQQEDQFLYPYYVSGGGGVYPFEIMTYATANLTGLYQYMLMATGGGGSSTVEDMLDWVMLSYPLRTTNHMTGTSSSGGATYSANWLDADGQKWWLIKNTAGNPWDINTYDSTYIYHYITENADLNDPGGPGVSHWGVASAFKRHANASRVTQPVPVMPRFFDISGSPVTITTNGPNYIVRTLACETDNEALINLGTLVETTQYAGIQSFGGTVGSQPTIQNLHTYGNQREVFSYCKGYGLVQWQHQNLISGTWVTDQTTTHNTLVNGGCPTPNFPCYSSIGSNWVGGVPGAGGNVANPSGSVGTGNKLRRGVFGTWASSSLQNTGPAHAIGSRFAFLDPTGIGMLKTDVLPSWVGKTLYFKFAQFTLFGSGVADISTLTAYPYTVTGGVNNTQGGGTGGSGGGGNSSYTISPANPLTQTSTTSIHMVNVTATFSPSGLQTFYVARDFTIPAPSSPTTYYVTIFDPNLTGDTGNSATLTSFCTTSQTTSFVGQPGYIYMGSIVATGSGTSGGGQSGGSNPSGSVTIQIPIPSTTSGDFSIAHGLGKIPSDVDIKIQSDGLIRFQSGTMWDATNVYLNASDNGLTGTLVIEL